MGVASDRLAGQHSSSVLLFSKTKPDIVGSTKMCLKAKFTKPASVDIKVAVAPVPTTKTPIFCLNHSSLVNKQIPGTLKTWEKLILKI